MPRHELCLFCRFEADRLLELTSAGSARVAANLGRLPHGCAERRRSHPSS